MTKAELKAQKQAEKLAQKEARQLAKLQAKQAKLDAKAAKQALKKGAAPSPAPSSPPANSPAPSNDGPFEIRGANPDINRDGVIDKKDVKLFAELMYAPFDLDGPSIDINGDGMIDAADLDALLLLVGTPPPPHTAPAPSPSASNSAPKARMFTTLLGGDTVEMTDADTGAVIIRPNGQKLWSGNVVTTNPTTVAPQIRLVPVTNGFDVVYTFHNTTNAPAGLGKLTVGGFRFGNIVEAHDFRYDGKPYTIDNKGRPISPGGWFYPAGQYSPVVVFGEKPYKVGVSLQYPILDYKHQVRLRISAPGGAFARNGLNWAVDVNLNPSSDPAKYNPGGDLRPGERRTYTLSVRVVKDGEDWINTLAPYRDYFRARYGGVKYTRDPRPVYARSAAQEKHQIPSNPNGFGHKTLRPDIYGWKPWTDQIIAAINSGWRRTMIWRPTGLAENHSVMKNPFQFTSHWLEGDVYGHNMADALTQLPRVRAAGGDIGLWWGSSVRVMRGWNATEVEMLDPDKPEHVALAFRELDIAVAAGARTIGLDAFRLMQPWDAWRWLQMMQRRAPGVKFIVEPMSGDLLHTLAPGFLLATRPIQHISQRLNTRHRLADYLNPGHETWGFIRRDRLASALGNQPTDAEVQAEVARVAALGYVPCVGLSLEFDNDDSDSDERFHAAAGPDD